MRIKKNELLEAITSNDTLTKITNASKTLDSAEDLENKAKPIIGDEGAEEFVKGVLTSNGKEELEEEGSEKVHTKKFDSCVKKVKANSDVDNAYAVCQDSLGEKAIKKSHRRTIKEVIKVKNLKK
jgi:hypothetical protein